MAPVLMPRRPFPTSLLPAVALVTTIACSVASAPVPTSCHEDAECPADAHCVESTCTADRPPRAAIAGPRAAATGTALTFDGSGSTDGDDDIVAYTWSVRALAATCAPDLGAASLGAFHPVFGCAGEYEVILVVRDRTGVVSEPAIVPLTITTP
jgi:hypothetical protein